MSIIGKKIEYRDNMDYDDGIRCNAEVMDSIKI